MRGRSSAAPKEVGVDGATPSIARALDAPPGTAMILRVDVSRVIVDGSNAIHAIALSGSEHAQARSPEARARFVEIVASAIGVTGVVVTFDDRSHAPPPSENRPEVVHVPDADEWIVATVRRDPARNEVIVVTSDRALSARVDALGARVRRPRETLRAGVGGSS